jgi:acetyl-CoA/propionyl-CoA carboxylase, biotin carboxylase, biotin carboxyl carrier protein
VLPFHRAVVTDPAFTSEPFSVHTRWIETEFAGKLPPYAGESAPAGADAVSDGASGPGERERVVVEVGGKRLEVVLPAGLGAGLTASSGAIAGAGARPGHPTSRRPQRGSGRGRGGAARVAPDGDALVSPMQGTIVKIVAPEGQRVSSGETIVVLEAMKMEQPLTAHKDGVVSELAVQVGQTVPAGQVICLLAD